MQECLSLVHGTELCSQSLENSLQSSGVCHESATLCSILRWHLNNGSLHIVRDPFNKIIR